MSYWVGVLIASSALALVLGLLTAAIQIAGINSMKLAYVLMFLGWVIGTAAIWISGLPLEYRMVCIVSLAMLIIFLVWWMVKKKVKQDRVIISYPWLETNHWLVGQNKEVRAVQLYVTVRDEPADPDAMTVSSLHNLKLDVSMPIAVGETGWHSCRVGRVDVAELNSYDVTSRPLFLVELKNDITVLEIRGSSSNAGWTQGTAVIHRKGDHVDWEKSLGGWVKTPQGKKALLVGETCQNGVTTHTKGKPINLTRDLLIQYGIPVKGN